MKKYLFIYIFLLSFTIFGQTNQKQKELIGSIVGKVLDKNTKQALPYVNIICKNNKNEIIAGSITNNKGVFTVQKLVLDSIFIDIQFIGYKTLTKKIALSKQNTKSDLGILFLLEDATNLDEVIINSETSTIVQKIDRKIINIGKDIASSGTNSLQMLENIPTVNVDYQTGKINLRGNDNVRVLIDGKPSNLSASQLLKQIPSSSVKK